jgi:glycosyltransferase involved in cell wall biosynthesis
VATDVGDSALMIGATGRVIPPRDPQRMADAWNDLLALTPEARRNMGMAARRRVCELFDLDAVTRRYESLYRSLVTRQSRQHFEPAPLEVVAECKAARVA